MPELPEVEITKRMLEPALLGNKITRVGTTAPSYFFLTSPSTLKKNLLGEETIAIERIGKYLLLNMRSGHRLFLHLGMTGQLYVEGSSNHKHRQDKHVHLTLHFSRNKPAVHFRDVRKFGKVRWLPQGKSDPRIDKLGPDALHTEYSQLCQHLWDASRKRSIPIKTFLLDQSVLAGIGNIYADEALFFAGIRPGKSTKRVSRTKMQELTKAAQDVLRRSIETGGSTIRDYVSPDGNDGANQHEHRVYGRKGLNCTKCETVIKRIVTGGRSTHYCPTCQC